MHQLTPTEATLLRAETVTNLGHYSLYLELGAGPDGKPPTFRHLRDLLAERLHLAPSLRRRIVEVPLSLDDPWWIEDPHFDLDYHVRHLAVPGASDLDALDQLLGRLHERPLDRSRPLWEMYLIDHPDGRRGLFIKVHMVVADELGPLGPLTHTTGPGNEAEVVGRNWRPDMMPTDNELLVKAGWSALRRPERACRRSLELAQSLPLVGRAAALVAGVSTEAPHPVERFRRDGPVPRASFNRTLGAHRRVTRVSLPLDEFRAVRRKLDLRFHDLLLAVIGGAIRHWLVEHDELIPEPLIALTPLVVEERPDRLGAALVPLATERHDPLERAAEVATAMSEIAEQLGPRSVSAIRQADGVPLALAGSASQMLATTSANIRFMPPFNLYVVNIPGGDFGDVDGFPVVARHALCPVIDGIGLSVSAVSHGDEVHVALVSDRDLIPDPEVIAERLAVELAELSALTDGAAGRQD